MKIGITERGDAAIDYNWVNKLDTVDAAIIITKNLTDKFIDTILEQSKTHNIILHCTCTGWGNSFYEPNVPKARHQLNQLKKLVDLGFNPKHIVLRVDPIIPTEAGLHRVSDVLTYFLSLNLGINRIRISVYDEYKHVKERLLQNGLQPLYGNNFYANKEQLQLIINTLSKFPLTYELCAENELYKLNSKLFEVVGCVSKKELDMFNLTLDINSENKQNRCGCHCLGCKTELLNNKYQCPHKCIYCYWR